MTFGYEAEAATFFDKVRDLHGKQVEVARIRTAYQIAVMVVEASNEGGKEKVVTQEASVDMEPPLKEEEKLSIMEDWDKRYNMVLSMWMDPADPLVNRMFREFRLNVPTLDVP